MRIVSWIVIILCGAADVFLLTQNEAGRNETSTWSKEQSISSHEISTNHITNHNTQAAEPIGERETSNKPSATGAADVKPIARDIKPKNFQERLDFAMTIPEFVRLFEQKQRGEVKAEYASLYRELALSPDKQAELLRLQVEDRLIALDTLSAAKDLGFSDATSADEKRGLIAASEVTTDESIKQLLDEQDYAKFLRYRSQVDLRSTISLLNLRVSVKGEPLSSAQNDRLVDAWNSAGGTRDGETLGVTGQTVAGNRNTNSILVLSPEQLAVTSQLLSSHQLKEFTQLMKVWDAKRRLVEIKE